MAQVPCAVGPAGEDKKTQNTIHTRTHAHTPQNTIQTYTHLHNIFTHTHPGRPGCRAEISVRPMWRRFQAVGEWRGVLFIPHARVVVGSDGLLQPAKGQPGLHQKQASQCASSGVSVPSVSSRGVMVWYCLFVCYFFSFLFIYLFVCFVCFFGFLLLSCCLVVCCLLFVVVVGCCCFANTKYHFIASWTGPTAFLATATSTSRS